LESCKNTKGTTGSSTLKREAPGGGKEGLETGGHRRVWGAQRGGAFELLTTGAKGTRPGER